jgi:hypothetical protein
MRNRRAMKGCEEGVARIAGRASGAETGIKFGDLTQPAARVELVSLPLRSGARAAGCDQATFLPSSQSCW